MRARAPRSPRRRRSVRASLQRKSLVTRPTSRPGDPFWDLVATARRLQAPGGCPWDRAQTVSSLLPHLIEETWETFDAVRNRRPKAVKAELGDVFYSVLFLALLAERQGWFRLQEMLTDIHQKMIRRHPHVFGKAKAKTPGDAYTQWQAVKQREGTLPSRSRDFRNLLVALWDLLRQNPACVRGMQKALSQARTQKRAFRPRNVRGR